jgi:hypothetical protein
MRSRAILLSLILLLSAVGMATGPQDTDTPPYLQATKTLSPGTIYAEGKGIPDSAEMNITVTGAGDPLINLFPQDVVFVIDSSGSMGSGPWGPGNDPTGQRIAAAKYYVDQLDISLLERAAIVDFDGSAILAGGDHLGTDYPNVKNNIELANNTLGGTNIPEAMQIASSELINYGWSNHTWIIILMTDGMNWCPPYGQPCPFLDEQMDDPSDPLVDVAIYNDIAYYTIGLGGNVNTTLLSNLANMTGGTYHPAADASELQAIYDEIHEEIVNTAAKDITITQTLTSDFDYVPGSFSVSPSDLVGKTATWEVSSLSIDESWTVTFDVNSDVCGFGMDVDHDTTVTYTSYDDQTQTILLPSLIVDVIGCNDAPFADCNGPYAAPEGTTVIFDGSGSSDPDASDGDYIVSYEWDLDGDGLYDDATGVAPSQTWGDNLDLTIGLKVTDTLGATDTDECDLSISNVAPEVHVNTPFVYELTQGGSSWSIPAVESTMSAEDFYDYHSASAHTGFEKPFQSFLYLYRDINDPTDEVSLFIVHDIDGNVFYPGAGYNSGSPDAESWMDLSGIPAGAYLAQSDDPGPPGIGGEFKFFPATGTAQGRWHWWFNTDGGAIGGLTAANPWCITIDPLMWNDVTSWAYYYTGGAHVDLDMNLPLTICYTPPTEPDTISIDEGGTVSLSGFFDDDGWEDTHTAVWDFDDTLTAPATFSPGAGFSHHNVDPATHAYGDDGTYTACLLVTDDDGAIGSDCVDIVVGNVVPDVVLPASVTVNEGSIVSIDGTTTDQGSDDLTFTWTFEDGPTVVNEYYNNGIGSEPEYDQSSNSVRTPWGTYPFFRTDTAEHTYCDNGLFDVDLTVEDDDHESGSQSTTVEVLNVPPAVQAGGTKIGVEATTLSFTWASFTDPGCDSWDWWWDFRPTFDSDGDGDPTNDADVAGGGLSAPGAIPIVTYSFNDNFDGDVYLWVLDDDGGLGFDTVHVTVANEAPEVSEISAYTFVDVTLRVAGEVPGQPEHSDGHLIRREIRSDRGIFCQGHIHSRRRPDKRPAKRRKSSVAHTQLRGRMLRGGQDPSHVQREPRELVDMGGRPRALHRCRGTIDSLRGFIRRQGKRRPLVQLELRRLDIGRPQRLLQRRTDTRPVPELLVRSRAVRCDRPCDTRVRGRRLVHDNSGGRGRRRSGEFGFVGDKALRGFLLRMLGF